jgi:hypothetical protein
MDVGEWDVEVSELPIHTAKMLFKSVGWGGWNQL